MLDWLHWILIGFSLFLLIIIFFLIKYNCFKKHLNWVVIEIERLYKNHASEEKLDKAIELARKNRWIAKFLSKERIVALIEIIISIVNSSRDKK
ncbi:MAG: hypothetical protein FWE36_06440 [Erysipelotrichales bacterium]|nr:hypothetical protein [Erysipelotrichales bacterium]